MPNLNNPLLTFEKIASVTGGSWITEPQNPAEKLIGAAFDTRQTGEAEIFFTLAGARNAHEFLPTIEKSKIKLAVVTEDVPPLAGIAILKVADSLQSLQLLARHQAQEFQGQCIAITGSSGKTTAKAWLEKLLNPFYNTLASPGSFNNHIGCPVTILSLDEATEIMILEMGTNGMGELDLLSSIGLANYSLLLNVGHAHIGKFGGLEQTYQAKLEIFAHQKENALSIVPHFDTKLLAATESLKRATFGENGQYSCQVTAQGERTQDLKLTTPRATYNFSLNQLGGYVASTFAALAVILDDLQVLGKLPQKIELPQEKGRSTLLTSKGGATILDDSYNANPESVINMLTTLNSLQEKRKLGIIGKLGELDKDLGLSAPFIIDNIPEGITDLYFLGESGALLTPLAQKKHPEMSITFIGSFEQLLEKIKDFDQKGVAIGIKGSRTAHLERVVFALEAKKINCHKDACPILQNCSSCKEL